MEDNKCCVCECVMEQKAMGLEFVDFTEARIPIYRKLCAFFCPRCKKYQEVEGYDG